MPDQQKVSSALNRLLAGKTSHFDLHALLRDTKRTLANLDFEHRYEMERVESIKADPVLKKQIAASLKRRHQERLQPYVMLIAELQRCTSPTTTHARELAI